jgi:hypothetical protein
MVEILLKICLQYIYIYIYLFISCLHICKDGKRLSMLDVVNICNGREEENVGLP